MRPTPSVASTKGNSPLPAESGNSVDVLIDFELYVDKHPHIFGGLR